MKAMVLLMAAGLVAGCVAVAPPPAPGVAPRPGPVPAPGEIGDARDRAATFVSVVARVEPVAEAICRARLPRGNCDLAIAVDDRPGAGVNAFQTLDDRGRPFVVFTLGLLGEARNADELAFVLGHEAAHHIAGHLPRRQEQAALGAALAGAVAAASGLSEREAQTVQAIGADLAARQYSVEFELEADALGAEIALAAGYDPVQGAAFFARLPEPGDGFLASHPPNAERQARVAAVVARLRGF